jgi:2-aminoadipate transaminase
MFLMVTLPDGMDAGELLREAIAKKVAFVPGEDFHTDGQGRNTMRLNFSNASPELIYEGIRRLGFLLGRSETIEERGYVLCTSRHLR